MLTIQEELKEAEVATILFLKGKEHTVHTVATLQELYQRTGSSEWIPRGKTSRALGLTGGLWLFWLPQAEAEASTWFRMTRQEGESPRAFFKGGETPATWGPARRFARQEQTGTVQYTLHNQEWQMRDLGAVRVTADGAQEVLHTGDRLYFVTSQAPQGDPWLFFLDARPGEAQGSGGLFVGPRLDLTDIETVL